MYMYIGASDKISEKFLRRVHALRTRQNCRHIAVEIYKRIFVNEIYWISIEISLKPVPKGPIKNMPAYIGSDNGLALIRRQAII